MWFQCLDRSVQGNSGVSTGTLGTGTLSCSQRGFTSPSTLNQLPTARQKHQNSPKSGIPYPSNSTSGHDHQNAGCEFSKHTTEQFFSSHQLCRCQKCNHLKRAAECLCRWQFIHRSSLSSTAFHSLLPSIGTSLKAPSDQGRLIATRKFSVWRSYD